MHGGISTEAYHQFSAGRHHHELSSLQSKHVAWHKTHIGSVLSQARPVLGSL